MTGRKDGGIVVTGASSGIGAAIALELAQRGSTVACLSRRGTSPVSKEPAAPEIGGRLVPYTCDIADAGRAAQVLADFAGLAGGIRGLVNNAGRQAEADSAEMELDLLREMLEVNVVGTFSMCRLAYPYVRRHGGGVIVNVGSFYDHRGARRNLAYAACKAAIASMTRTLAVEWAREGIAVVTVAPGYILTDMNRQFLGDEAVRARVERRIPVRRLGRADEVGKLVAALIQERIGFLTGTTIYIDGAHGINL